MSQSAVSKIFGSMPPRKSRSLAFSARKHGRKEDSNSPKRPIKKSAVEDAMDIDSTVSFASSTLISRHAMAATRIQRVWRSTFSKCLTKQFATEFLKPTVGVTIDYVKSIRYYYYLLYLILIPFS